MTHTYVKNKDGKLTFTVSPTPPAPVVKEFSRELCDQGLEAARVNLETAQAEVAKWEELVAKCAELKVL